MPKIILGVRKFATRTSVPTSVAVALVLHGLNVRNRSRVLCLLVEEAMDVGNDWWVGHQLQEDRVFVEETVDVDVAHCWVESIATAAQALLCSGPLVVWLPAAVHNRLDRGVQTANQRCVEQPIQNEEPVQASNTQQCWCTRRLALLR